ncbi:signal recognition particle subunit SRP19, putative [Plasmodium relictum]|uniref:Signal recognition particle subunit SRP19, putative n=1 Tax=Plasmodium relictum TaxID=85471 RepID=A0A1J1HCA7_PLARL|nr:signal recognition particle subunit SRP19, putative [Plasmodium relictum]CRH02592.1 signal recognition particle subunit SRP19, putative [Plasmodium relictum]
MIKPEVNINNENFENKDISRWKIIYPNYINKKKKVKEGRRINLNYCVNDPSIEEIELACKELNVTYHVEKKKCYPRDWQVQGRIRIKLPDAENNILSKFDLMKKIGLKLQTVKANNESSVVTNQSNLTKKKKKSQR